MKSLVSTTMMVARLEELYEVEIEGYIDYHTEANWGSDRDGNRGIKVTIVDEVTDIVAYDEKGDDFILTAMERENAADLLTGKFFGE